ncbi:hypothetical protein TcYC6_0120560 [Trypanosoma cruzi]|nr:hypothetical protein TcYC6_0120560 [Trypanosoma cruzi]
MCGLATLISVLFCRDDLDLIASTLSSPPCGCTVVSKGSMRPQGTAVAFIRGSVRGKGNASLSASGVLAIFLTPYSVEPWVCLVLPAFYWMIGTAEM